MKSPNILFITTDQQRWDSLSLYNQPGYKTPNLDKLAINGVYFDRAYTPEAICTPARISMITGQYPSRHGGWQIGMSPVPALKEKSMGHLFTESGYHTALIGKTHFVARNIESQHIAGIASPTPGKNIPDEEFWDHFTGPYMGFEYVQQEKLHTCACLPSGSYRAWLKRKGLNVDKYFWTNKIDGKGVDYNGNVPQGKWDLDESLNQTAWITEESIKFIEEKSQTDKPWLCWASYQDPHPPYVASNPFYDKVDMTDVVPLRKKEGEFDNKPPFYKNYSEKGQWDDGYKNFWADYIVSCTWNYNTIDNPLDAQKAYIAMVNKLDSYVGKLLDSLEKNKQLENTLIIFTTDHGDFMGNHGFWEKGLPSYDDNQRIPAIMYWGNAQKKKIGKTDSMFNLVDILPTCLDAANINIPPFVQGISQLPILKSESTNIRDWALIEYKNHPTIYQQTLIHDNYRLVVYKDQIYGELYNLKTDPNQYNNLFDNNDFSELRNKLMHKLLQVNMEKDGVMPKRIAHA